MAQIIRQENDPFHNDVYVCSNCDEFIFSAHANCEPVELGKTVMAKIVWESVKNKSIPNICPKCLEPLEFPREIEIPLCCVFESTNK